MSLGEEVFALDCQREKLKPEREFRFAPPRRWRFDFAWIKERLAVEIEGGTWINGRHNRGSSIEADMEKYNTAALLGWKVLRYTTAQVENGKAIREVLNAL